ncbi:MAG: lysyl oxidase family protein [Myxococcota bacterium]|nr:lysyl oxidase family protein [Myxococcota bacterium]
MSLIFVLGASLLAGCEGSPQASSDEGMGDAATASAPMAAFDSSQRDMPDFSDGLGPDGALSVDGGVDVSTVEFGVTDIGVPDAALDGGSDVGLPDLVLLQESLLSDVWLDEIFVTEDSCVFLEGCVAGVGMRRLLRFAVATANIGDVDLEMGRPADSPDLFEYSGCHEHFHFDGYADYNLASADGEVARGHKQAFCLMDTDRYWTDDESVPDLERYSCGYQGITRGWADTYGSHLDCQWIDVTGVAPGDYRLHVAINEARRIVEKTYDNNDHSVEMTVSAFDLAGECQPNARTGTRRSCGWTPRFTEACRAGDLVEVGCGGCSGFGAPCGGNPMLRVCDGDGTQCLPSTALAENDDACDDSLCPHVEFMCPDSGLFTVWTGQHDIAVPADCSPSVRSGPPVVTRDCAELTPRGFERTCGWLEAIADFECRPGFVFRVGCNPGNGACNVGGLCNGDPMLRVCSGSDPCLAAQAVVQNDDGCGTQCPSTEFECPLSGRVSVYTAPYRHGQLYSCEVGIEGLD